MAAVGNGEASSPSRLPAIVAAAIVRQDGAGVNGRPPLRQTTTSRRTRWGESTFYGLSAVLLVAPLASQPETLRVAHVRPDESLHGGQHLLDVIAVVVNPLVQQLNDAQLADRRVIA